MSSDFQPGQRWASDPEPELGLGTVVRSDPRTVILAFPACAETRCYSRDNAPLRRVTFRVGDSIKAASGQAFTITAISQRNGLLIYHGSGRELSEADLSGSIGFSQPGERLRAGHTDSSAAFDLRVRALHHQHARRQSAVRGLAGARIDLIPHQLHIAREVADRLNARVLLADEVGLGKTIEACLILHRLLATGRIGRALILVPEPLIHQWFVELLRRFNLWFHLFDEERCSAVEAAEPEANPFLDDQLVLAPLELLTRDPRRAGQALLASWDLLIVDEAHHLEWNPEAPGPAYTTVEALARSIPNVLLLTATPEQLGLPGHLARLRLLDPARYQDAAAFHREIARYRDVAAVAETLARNLDPTPAQFEDLARLFDLPAATLRAQWDADGAGTDRRRRALLEALLDRHGTGRVMFRNTRRTMDSFPGRRPHLIVLEPDPDEPEETLDALAEEMASDLDHRPPAGGTFDFTDDPRLHWLKSMLRQPEPRKLLVICRTREKVEAIAAALRSHLNVKCALFHESIPLIQRDRNAAWFADEEGARLLLCSEIGSEGRNFQFAHDLVLFDLPLDPELLEQRIGRLDRIGQRSDIHIHVPIVRGSAQAVLARWLQDGLNAFARSLRGGRALLEQFHDRLRETLLRAMNREPGTDIVAERLLEDSRVAASEMTRQLEDGRDRLLELNSHRPESARRVVDEIRRQDANAELDRFMLDVFDHHGIQVEEIAPRTFQLGSAGVFADSFPGLPADGLLVTADRSAALAREDIQFLTWDHPLVTAALDLILGGEPGNCAFAAQPDAPDRGLLLETIHVLECLAPPALHVDRFLPPTPVRVLVDHRGQNRPEGFKGARLKEARPHALLDIPSVRDELIPHLLETSRERAQEQVQPLIDAARARMQTQLDHEIERLEALHRVNPSVTAEEVRRLRQHRQELDAALGQARLRLDALRLVQRG